MSTERFDAEAAYDEKIAPLMTQIIAICREHRIPVFASFNYANTEENGVSFCTTHDQSGRDVPQLTRCLRAVEREPVSFGLMITSGKAP